MKKFTVSTLLCSLFLLHAPLTSTCHAVEINEYDTLFHQILDNLRTNYWSPDGNWEGDWMHDAGGLAPRALYPYGIDSGDQDLIDKANITFDRNLDLFMELLGGNTSNMVEALMGITSGPDALRFYSGEKYQDFPLDAFGWLGLFLTQNLIKWVPNPLGDYLGYIFPLGAYAYTAFEVASIVKGFVGITATSMAEGQIVFANDTYWVDESYGGVDYGYYYDPTYGHRNNEPMNGFANGPMLTALAWAYGVTQEEDHLLRANALLDGVNTRIWDAARGGYAHSLHDNQTKHLSDNTAYAVALVQLYDATAQSAYLDRAREVLDFIQADLLIEDQGHPGYFICSHDWTSGSGASSSFCTGCNFAVLFAIYRLNELVQVGPTYPDPIPVCGQLLSGDDVGGGLVVLMLLLLPPGLVTLWLRGRLSRR